MISKRTHLLSIFLIQIFISSSIFSQVLEITSPNSNTQCRASEQCTISWTFNENEGGFKIEYENESGNTGVIDIIDNNSSMIGEGFANYVWTVPINLEGDTQIKITEIKQSGGFGSWVRSDPFEIIPGMKTTITSPSSGTYTNGDVVTVQYTTNDSNLQFYLRNASNQNFSISLNASNQFTISSSIAEGDYRIFADGDQTTALSNYFRIEPKRITVTYPYDGIIFERGVAKPAIEWTANYVPTNGVRITIETDMGTFELANGVGPNSNFTNVDSRYIWEIPDDFTKGWAYIQIKDKTLFQIGDYQDGSIIIEDPYDESFTLNSAKSTSISKPITSYAEIDGLSNSEKSESISYVDGTGKIRQTVSLNSTPDGADMISFFEYNELGQKVVDYLPYASDEIDGLYITDPKTDQENFYSNSSNDIAVNTHAYSRTIVEASPLQTVKEQGAPGEQYQPGNGNTIRYETHANTSADQIVHWKISGSSIVGQGFYPPGSIIISKTIDEDENESLVYTDREGREVLKVGYQNPTTPVQTYYVYDKYGNLRFIIPPEAVDEIEATTNYQTMTISTSSSIYTDWITEMRYDGYQRVVWKKIPEAEPVYTVYDKFGRVALTQDGNMRPNNEWFFTKYDIQGRAILTGVYIEESTSRDTREEMQNYLTNWTGAPWEDRTNANYDIQHGYTNNTFPNPANLERLMIWSVTYYDDYDFNYDGTPDESYVDNPEFTGTADGIIQNPEVDNVRTHGMVTGSKTRILRPQQVYENDNGVYGEGEPSAADEVYIIGTGLTNYQIRLVDGFRTKPGQTVKIGSSNVDGLGVPSGVMDAYTQGEWLESVQFYDKYGRGIYTKSTNHVGGQDQSWTQYYFDGKVNRTKTVHSSASTTTTIRQRMQYDHAGRVLATYHNVDNLGEVKIVDNEYNELSQLIKKRLNEYTSGSFWQTVDYKYHLRGWLESVNDPSNLGADFFGYKLYYDTIPTNGQSLNKFNGNIIAQDWATKLPSETERHRYSYSYDGLNQLTSANMSRRSYTTWQNNLTSWNTAYTFDLNGNIQSLFREGAPDIDGYPTNLDNLSYTYQGNKITAIADSYGHLGFADLATTTEEYLYDANGNMIEDKNKGISQIRYNRMNLPEVITFSNGNEIHYLYDAAGSKLQKIAIPAAGGQTTTDYSGGFVYTNNSIDFFAFSEGRVRKVGANWQYQYDLKDHLGNVRTTFTNENGVATLLQADSYYPFGYKMPGLSYQTGAENKFTYNGKELEDEFGLDWYHYGARYYDPVIGRWWAIDPADQYSSSYSYVGNTPIMKIDPDGMVGCDWFVCEATGEIAWVKGNHEDAALNEGWSRLGDDQYFGNKGYKMVENLISKGLTNYTWSNEASLRIADHFEFKRVATKQLVFDEVVTTLTYNGRYSEPINISTRTIVNQKYSYVPDNYSALYNTTYEVNEFTMLPPTQTYTRGYHIEWQNLSIIQKFIYKNTEIPSPLQGLNIVVSKEYSSQNEFEKDQ